MGKALDVEERLHVCFTINASIISVKHFTCDLFHFRYLFKMRCNSLKCVIIFVVRKQVLCHYFNELSFFVVYKDQAHYHDYRLDVWADTFEQAFIELAAMVHKFFDHQGVERPDVPHVKPAWALELQEIITDVEKWKDEEG